MFSKGKKSYNLWACYEIISWKVTTWGFIWPRTTDEAEAGGKESTPTGSQSSCTRLWSHPCQRYYAEKCLSFFCLAREHRQPLCSNPTYDFGKNLWLGQSWVVPPGRLYARSKSRICCGKVRSETHRAAWKKTQMTNKKPSTTQRTAVMLFAKNDFSHDASSPFVYWSSSSQRAKQTIARDPSKLWLSLWTSERQEARSKITGALERRIARWLLTRQGRSFQDGGGWKRPMSDKARLWLSDAAAHTISGLMDWPRAIYTIHSVSFQQALKPALETIDDIFWVTMKKSCEMVSRGYSRTRDLWMSEQSTVPV